MCTDIESQTKTFRPQLCTGQPVAASNSLYITARRCKYRPPPQATTPNNTRVQSSDTVMRFLVINYQQKHQRLRMSSHFLRKQLVTGFLTSVSSIYQKKIGREKEIKFFYCIKASSVVFMGYRALLHAGSHFC